MRAPLLHVLRDARSTWGQSLGLLLLVSLATLALGGAHRARRILLATQATWTEDLALADLEVLHSPTHADVEGPVRALGSVAVVESRLLLRGRCWAAGLAPLPALVHVLPASGRTALDRVHVLEGREPLPGEAAVLVDRSLTALHDLGPGRRLTVEVGGRRAEFAVVGVVVAAEHLVHPAHPECALPLQGALAVLHLTPAAAARLEVAGTLKDSLLVRFRAGADVRAATREVVAALAMPPYAVVPRDELPSMRVLGMVTSVFEAYLPVVASVLLAVSLLLLMLTVARRVGRARLEIGTLLALGHRTRAVVLAAAGGALAPTLLGGALGFGLHGPFARLLIAPYKTSLGLGPFVDPGVGPEAWGALVLTALAAALSGAIAAAAVAHRPAARLLRAGSAGATHAGPVARALAVVGRGLPTSVLLGLLSPLRHVRATALGVLGLGSLLATVLAFLSVHLAYEDHATDVSARVGLDAVVRFEKPVGPDALAALAARAQGRVEPLVSGVAVLRLGGSDGTGADDGFVQAVGLEAGEWARRLRLVEGRALGAEARDEVLVDRWIADRRGVGLGARVTLFPTLSAPEGLEARVVGIVETLSVGRVYLPLAAARSLYDLGEASNGAQVLSPLAPEALEQTLAQAPDVESATSLKAAVRGILQMFAGGRRILILALGVSVLLTVLFLGVLGAMDAAERMPDVAVLHALGWRDRALRALLLTEVGLRGLLALGVAMLAARPLTAALLARLGAANHVTLVPPAASWLPLILVCLCALALPLAAWPAWHAVRTLAPARALRLLVRE